MLDERDCDPIVVNGVKKGSSSIFISKVGTSVIGVDAYVSAEAVSIILSFAEVKDQCGDRVRFNAEKDQFDIQIFENGEIYHFRRSGQSNLYLCNLGDMYHRTVQVTTVADKMKLYTKREISAAVKARALQRRLGFVSTEQLTKMLNIGMLLRCDISKRDMLWATGICGQDIGELKRKATARKRQSSGRTRRFRIICSERIRSANAILCLQTKGHFSYQCFGVRSNGEQA